ncbi:MAG: phosphoglycolate phosphatase [Frankiaceae bacterium]|nr:phosphoglycolate phosphatase [Frankiaceae bacterium]
MVTVRIVYSDLDGTMVGPRGCFFRAEGGAVDLEPARALADLLAAGIPLVLVSGRTKAQLIEACGIFGADGYIAELGALLGWRANLSSSHDVSRAGTQLIRGAMPEQLDAVPDDLVERLLTRFAGRLEFHSPWHLGHEIDVMLRGQVDVEEAEAWLADEGFGWLRCRDNGVLPSTSESLAASALEISALHVYHLVPEGIGKGVAVAEDLVRRGIDPADALAIGDSASDLEMARVVGHFSLVENGARPPHMAALVAAHTNVRVEQGSHGAGWAAAVRRALVD